MSFLMKLVTMFTRLPEAHLATTAEEKEAIYRFRYRVYVQELGKPMKHADHERKRLYEAVDDDEEHTANFYCKGSDGQVTGVLRVHTYGPGEVPPELFRACSMDKFAGVEQLRVAELGRAMVDRNARGGAIFLALTVAAARHCVLQGRSDLVFLFAVPGLVRHYQSFGLRPFGGRPLSDETGLSVPLVLVPSDLRHLRKIGSPFLSLAPDLVKVVQKLEPLDLEPFEEQFDTASDTIEFDSTAIESQVVRALSLEDEPPAVFEGLEPKAIKRLLNSSFVLQLGEDDPIVLEGMVDREVYVVLEGLFAVERGGHQLAVLGPGEVFGELAFFSTAGKRTAQVRSLSDSRVLVLRRKFLKELVRKDPDAGFQLMANLARIVADRFGDVQEVLEDALDEG